MWNGRFEDVCYLREELSRGKVVERMKKSFWVEEDAIEVRDQNS
jgi:hypothetical protein